MSLLLGGAVLEDMMLYQFAQITWHGDFISWVNGGIQSFIPTSLSTYIQDKNPVLSSHMSKKVLGDINKSSSHLSDNLHVRSQLFPC